MSRVERVLYIARRRRARQHAAVAAVAASLAVLSTLAVRYDLASRELGGVTGLVVNSLEVVFIAGIIPLVTSALYFGASALVLRRRLRREDACLPRAHARR